jgi:hypothetical protein
MLNETVIFRATDELAEAIQQRAGEAQMTVSEYLRLIISEHLGVPELVSPTCADIARAAFFDGDQSPYRSALARKPLVEGFPDPDPFQLMAFAAEGDIRAQRLLADMAILVALAGEPQHDPFMVLSEGLILARMADRVGDVDDAMRVVTMLALASTLATGNAARDMAGEAIARMEIIANGNSHLADDAADLLANCADRERSDTMRIAKEYRDRLAPLMTEGQDQ